MATDSRLETWIAQGEMDIERIFHRVHDAINNFGFDFDEEKRPSAHTSGIDLVLFTCELRNILLARKERSERIMP